MSKSKSRSNADICADCGSTEPIWASVNRGILICSECCIVHRSLGRHISQIKSLDKSFWYPSQLSMVIALNKAGANNIWEYSLPSTPSKLNNKKPKPKDSLLSTKTEFIRSKHARSTWTIRPPKPTGLNEVANDLNQNLHASARSSNLHTSLRLLVQGADPNYFHDEKGSTPLHVAAKSNQIAQAELLLVYGADPCHPDALGRNAVETARQAGNIELADRLFEACFELTDRLSYFLCGKFPDHKAGQHILVPEIKGDAKYDTNVLSRSKLQMLPNRLFEEIAMDVFDEIDRREIEAIWQNTPNAINYGAVPFLPVHSEYSTTRNQARQKLARLESKEFNTVVLDILMEARRRQHLSRLYGIQDPSINLFKKDELRHVSQISDDEPLYDSVASDDDYAALTPIMITEKKSTSLPSPNSNVGISRLASSNSPPSSSSSNNVRQRLSTSDPQFINDTTNDNQLFDRLRQSDCTIAELREEVNALRTLVERLSLENCDLRSKLTSSSIDNSGVELRTNEDKPIGNGHAMEMEPVQDVRQVGHKTTQRPASMYEARDRDWQTVKNQREETSRPAITQSLYQCSKSTSASGQPLFEEISRRTNQVTRRIQELWSCMQNSEYKDGAIPCAERIRVAVAELTAVIPQNRDDEVVRTALRQLITGTARLQVECAGLHRASSLNQSSQTETYLHLVRTCAYDIAKATKLLVTKFENQG